MFEWLLQSPKQIQQNSCLHFLHVIWLQPPFFQWRCGTLGMNECLHQSNWQFQNRPHIFNPRLDQPTRTWKVVFVIALKAKFMMLGTSNNWNQGQVNGSRTVFIVDASAISVKLVQSVAGHHLKLFLVSTHSLVAVINIDFLEEASLQRSMSFQPR